MRTPLLNSFTNIERLRLLPWALAALLLVTQLWSGAHKALVDGHESGQYCQACVLADREDAPPDAISGVPAFNPRASDEALHLSAGVAARSFHRLPPSRAPPLQLS